MNKIGSGVTELEQHSGKNGRSANPVEEDGDHRGVTAAVEENATRTVTAMVRFGPAPIKVRANSVPQEETSPRSRTSQLVTFLTRRRRAAVPGRSYGTLREQQDSSLERLQSEFLQLCLPLFFAGRDSIHCLGLTSAVASEGKTLAAWLISCALATNSGRPVVLVECDWQRPTFTQELGLPETPGLAEYLTGQSGRDEVRYTCRPNLTIIPAGQGGADTVTALALLERRELYKQLADPDEMMILDLPSVLGSHYGVIAARLAEALLMVARAGSTPSPVVAQACAQLKHLRVEGIILNQVQMKTPRWLQSLL
jgi:Mrp family chromosome partitioning ATPase